MSRFQATIYVRLPEQLRQMVSAEAHRRMLKDSDVVREALAEHFTAAAARGENGGALKRRVEAAPERQPKKCATCGSEAEPVEVCARCLREFGTGPTCQFCGESDFIAQCRNCHPAAQEVGQ